jgi:hypothetical protein
MKVTENKELEKLVDRMMSDATLQSPSFDFTSKVMSQVLSAKTSDATVYKPLISKWVFMAVFGIVCALSIYVSVYGESTTERWWSFIDYTKIFNIRLLMGFSISKGAIYAIMVSMAMFCVQIAFLKNYFNKQIGV